MVSIIILAHNQLKFTKQCLSSLLSFTSQIQTPYETIVVDNASTDGTKEYLQGLEQSGQIKVIYNTENKGFPTANNQAAAIAKGEYLCLCNNDIVFTQDWLVKLLRCIKSDNTLVAVGPYTSHSSGYQQVRPQPTYKGEEDLQKYAAKFSDEEKYVDFLVFFCVLIKRKIWDEIGGLNECYGRGCFEDNEFNYRVVQKGYKMKLAGDCFVHHYSGMTFGQKESPQKTKEYASLLAKNQRIFLKNVDRYETISLIMICADSEKPETLKKCLDSVCEFVDEICIVFNYKYYPQPWKIKKLKSIYEKLGVPTFSLYIKFTNFSDMRNRSINMATSRYVLWMDADDTCQTPIGIRDIILLNPHIDVFKWRILSYTERKTIETILHSRLFRRMKNNKVPQWINRCHEDIAYSMNELDYTHSLTDLTIQHWGYVNRESWHKKNVRNLKLMQQDIDEIKAKIEPSKNDQGRMSMIYYGIVNSLIILASRQRSKRKYKTLVQALNTTDECIKLLKDEDPLMAKMWVLRGIVCLDASEILAAKQSFHKAYDEWKQPEAAINLSEIYLREKNWNKSIEIGEEILTKYNGAYPISGLSYDPVHMHGLLLEKLGHAYANKSQSCKDNPEAFDNYLRKAEGFYKEALNIRPNLEMVNILTQILCNTNRFDEAAFINIKAVNTWPGYWVGWKNIAEYELLNGRKHTAKLFFKEAQRLKPGNKDIEHNLRMIGEIK